MRSSRTTQLGVAMLGFASAVAALCPKTARAEGPVFVWSDSSGNLHATDRLQDVPEPYYSTYSERLKALEKQGVKWEDTAPEPAPRPPPPTTTTAPQAYHPYTAADEEALRHKWHDLVLRWRAELTLATQDLQKVQDERDQAAMNPLLRQIPQNREQLAALEIRLQDARNRVMTARQVLLEALPKKARDEHVPLLYLR